ncbi:acyl-CoA thioesterase [Rickettsiella endosymbiont of Dermanyssus gallinae]|uniref:acyl-CoA thioesterase n=1 Tax=Rickettsiella endosymbiont of Dermanyssus gallinae TaxID=2856608 RepID=UPI001C52925A|nr:acyl-CoA thioesterase [Rickettsiella endosymbiont of Dermanyssus gallinae]
MITQPAKPVAASAIHDHTYKIFPNDLNSTETVFGGLIMATLDRVASVVAERHSGKSCVTASVDAMHFLKPARRGDILIFQASINRSWQTSMEVGVRVLAEDYRTGDRRHMVSAYFTFVATDEHGAKTPVPHVIAETEDEKRRYQEAGDRRDRRRQEAETRRSRK